MALLSTAAQGASLANDYGATKGSNAAASHEVALFDGDPELGGVELAADGGYARVSWTNNGTNWPTFAGGSVTSATVTFPTSSDAWSDTATHFILYDGADSVTQWDSGLLAEEVAVDEAGVSVRTELTIYYEDLSP